jgi:hypothetical protein
VPGRADLLPNCGEVALPGARNHLYLYSKYLLNCGGAMGIRTSGLLHAMNHSRIP